jgi:hypothetical protein
MGLAGNLGEFQLGELLQVLAMGRKTGPVSVKGDVATGRLVLVAGRVVHAEIEDGEQGEAAFFALLQNAAGSFRFVTDASMADLPITIDRGLDSLLLEGTHPPG